MRGTVGHGLRGFQVRRDRNGADRRIAQLGEFLPFRVTALRSMPPPRRHPRLAMVGVGILFEAVEPIQIATDATNIIEWRFFMVLPIRRARENAHLRPWNGITNAQHANGPA